MARYPVFPPVDDGEPQKPLIQWYRLVVEYYHRRLTFPSDKGPAIKGLVASLGKEIQGQFIDGL
jgi:hypothetical protein